MTNIYLITLAHAVVTVLVALVWLVRTHLELKGDYRALIGMVQGNNNDIAGLYSAVLTVDSRVATADERAGALSAEIAALQQSGQSAHPYSVTLQKVRDGASVDELMRDCSLCRDEADLLIRLHGSEK